MRYFDALGLALGIKKKGENPGKPENITN